MSKYFSLVRFEDKGVLHVASSSEIRDFEPTHPNDFDKEREYDIFWQQGEGSFDGFYSARIICQAASLEELKLKALNSNIKKMPANYKLLIKQQSQGQSLKVLPDRKPQSQQVSKKRLAKRPEVFSPSRNKADRATSSIKRKKGTENSSVTARKKRMLETLQEIKKQAPCNVPDPEERDKVLVKHESCSQLMKSDAKLKTPEKMGLNDTLPVSRSPSFSDNQKVNALLRTIADLDSDKVVSPKRIVNSSDEDNNTSSDSDGGSREESPVVKIDLVNTTKESESSESEDDTSKLMAKISVLEKQISLKEKQIKDLKDKHDSELETVTVNFEKQIKTLRLSCKISEEDRFKLIAELSKVKSEEGNISGLRQENRKLRALITAAHELLFSGLSKFTASSQPVQKPVSKQLDFSTPRKSLSNNSSGPGPFSPDELGSIVENQRAFEESISKSSTPQKQSLSKSPQEDTSYSSASGSFHRSISKPSTIQKQSLSKSSQQDISRPSTSGMVSTNQKDVGLSEEEIAEIAEKVRKDMTGEMPLATDSSGRVLIGGGIVIPKQKWDQGIKVQTKNSLFVTKLGQAVYGHEGLKSRTIGKQRKKDGVVSKQTATPSKIDAVVACLRGKILAADPTTPNIQELSATAKNILAQKMQDEARPPRGSKKHENN